MSLWRDLRLLRQTTEYEFRKVLTFRVGFFVREIMNGVTHSAVMICVYFALYSQASGETIHGWSFEEIVHYMILAAAFQKILFYHRLLDVAEQIFSGHLTKFLVMPFRYFTLPLGRFVQHTVLQLAVASLFYAIGLLLVPEWWPRPVSAVAAFQSLTLVLLGSGCFLLAYYCLAILAFWLDVVWSISVMFMFLANFVAGRMIPVSQMPAAFGEVFSWTFPYWALSAPIEIFIGRAEEGFFLQGLAVLLPSLVGLEMLRRISWSRGRRRYVGAGM
jgi:ABC-2 type transport system permease protein